MSVEGRCLHTTLLCNNDARFAIHCKELDMYFTGGTNEHRRLLPLTCIPLQAALSQAGNGMCVLDVCKHICPCLLSDVDNVSTTNIEKKQHAVV